MILVCFAQEGMTFLQFVHQARMRRATARDTAAATGLES